MCVRDYLVCMVGVIFVYIDTVYMGFMGILFFFMLGWMFQHDYLDTYCFECLICMFFVFLPVQRMFHMERCSRNMLIIIIIITVKYLVSAHYHVSDHPPLLD